MTRLFSLVGSSPMMQEALGRSFRAGCSQRVQAPDEWEVMFQVMMEWVMVSVDVMRSVELMS